jgi:hypothetical protein
MVAARLANMPLGGAKYRSANLQTDISQSEAANILNISERSVASAKKVLNEGTGFNTAILSKQPFQYSQAISV